MARTAKKTIPITIEFPDGTTATANVNRSAVTLDNAPEVAARYQTAELNSARLKALNEKAKKLATDLDRKQEYEDTLLDIESLRPRADQTISVIDFGCGLIHSFNDYYLTEEDEKAGRPLVVSPESLRQLDPTELMFIIDAINKKLALAGEEGKGSSASLQDGSQTKATEPAAPPTSIQSTP